MSGIAARNRRLRRGLGVAGMVGFLAVPATAAIFDR